MQVGRMSRAVQAHGRTRGLSTARAALRVAWLLARRPEGVRADEVAEMLGKSVSTAYNVLASLCEEGVAVRHPGGLYRLAPAFRQEVADAASPPPPIPRRATSRGLADELLRAHPQARLRRRGARRRPARRRRARPARDAAARAWTPRSATARTRSPWARSSSRWPGPRRSSATCAPACPPSRRRPITDPDRLRARARGHPPHRRRLRLRGVRRSTSAAWPRRSSTPRGHFLAVAGISMTRRAFAEERPALEAALLDVGPSRRPRGHDGGAVPAMCGSARGS